MTSRPQPAPGSAGEPDYLVPNDDVQPGEDPPFGDDQPPASDPVVTNPDPEQAWKALGLVNDWIRHADVKTGAFLAAAGVTGGVFYNLVRDQHHPSRWLAGVAIACAAAIFLAAAFALVALMPRLSVKQWWKGIFGKKEEPPPSSDGDDVPEDPTSLLFFRDIARAYKSDNQPSYAEVFATLSADKARLTRQISIQIQQNAHVAHRKFRWSSWSLRALGCDLVLLAWTAYLVGRH